MKKMQIFFHSHASIRTEKRERLYVWYPTDYCCFFLLSSGKKSIFLVIHKSTPREYFIQVTLMGRNSLYKLEFQTNSQERKAANTWLKGWKATTGEFRMQYKSH